MKPRVLPKVYPRRRCPVCDAELAYRGPNWERHMRAHAERGECRSDWWRVVPGRVEWKAVV